MNTKVRLPIVNESCRSYLTDLLGNTLSKLYFSAISKPMEEYSFHLLFSNEHIDDILEILNKNNFDAKTHKKFSNVIITRPKGPFELERDENLKEIVVDTRTAEMAYQGSDIFIPGIKSAPKVKQDDFVWIVNNQIKVAKGTALMSHNEILTLKKGIAIRNIQSPYITPSIQKLGLSAFPIITQSIPAYLTALNLEPESNDKILDCCAAPGNKTLHLAEITDQKASILSIDRSENRLSKLRNKIKLFKLRNIRTAVGNIIELSKRISAKFDKILIDPPCSGLGLRPKITMNCSKKSVNSISQYQKAIFFACNKLLKENGVVIYSTCTITKEENENVVKFVLDRLNYEISEQKFVLGKKMTLDANLSPPIQRFIPGLHKTPGYCIVKLRKC